MRSNSSGTQSSQAPADQVSKSDFNEWQATETERVLGALELMRQGQVQAALAMDPAAEFIAAGEQLRCELGAGDCKVALDKILREDAQQDQK